MTQPTRGFGVVVKRPFSASASARRIIASSNGENTALALLFSRRLDFLHRLAKVVRGLEAAVHRGETDVGDLVELRQLADHEVADAAGRYLALAERAQPLDHPVDRAFDLLGRNRALPQREHHAAHQLVAVEVGAAAVLLHQARHLEVDALIGGEALLALHALPAAADGVRLEVRAGVDHLRVVRPAERTLHDFKGPCWPKGYCMTSKALAGCRAFHAYTGNRAQSAFTSSATRARLASSAGRSSTSAMRWASCS